VTIDLKPAEEKIVLEGFNPSSNFDVMVVNGMLAKMRSHWLMRERLFRPVERVEPRPKVVDNTPINLDLLL